MARLSIILPALGTQSEIDETLVSLLENRPAGCQILVVCTANYQDPYDLHDEVQFVRIPATHRWMHFANAGLRQAHSPYLQLLLPGVCVRPGWEKAPLATLSTRLDVAAIAPPVAAYGHVPQLLAGAALTSERTRQLLWYDDSPATRQRLPLPPLGPSRYAGYFRTDALRAVGGWNPQIDPRVADLELTLRLCDAGWSCIPTADHDLFSIVPLSDDGPHSFTMVRDLERVCRKYAGALPRQPYSAASHAAEHETPREPTPGWAHVIVRIAGRLAGRLGEALPPQPMGDDACEGEAPRPRASRRAA